MQTDGDGSMMGEYITRRPGQAGIIGYIDPGTKHIGTYQPQSTLPSASSDPQQYSSMLPPGRQSETASAGPGTVAVYNQGLVAARQWVSTGGGAGPDPSSAFHPEQHGFVGARYGTAAAPAVMRSSGFSIGATGAAPPTQPMNRTRGLIGELPTESLTGVGGASALGAAVLGGSSGSSRSRSLGPQIGQIPQLGPGPPRIGSVGMLGQLSGTSAPIGSAAGSGLYGPAQGYAGGGFGGMYGNLQGGFSGAPMGSFPSGSQFHGYVSGYGGGTGIGGGGPDLAPSFGGGSFFPTQQGPPSNDSAGGVGSPMSPSSPHAGQSLSFKSSSLPGVPEGGQAPPRSKVGFDRGWLFWSFPRLQKTMRMLVQCCICC